MCKNRKGMCGPIRCGWLSCALVAITSIGCVPDGPTLTDALVPGAANTIAPAGSATVTPEAKPELVTLVQCLRYAALHNAGLEAAFNQWQAALEQVPQARSLPDPRFSYRHFIEQVETRVGPQRQAVGLSQMFPWFGKRSLRGDVAQAAANAAKARYDAKKLQLFRTVKRHYYEYYYLMRAIEVVDENRKLVEYLEQVARTRFKTATADHPDVIRAQIELGKLADRLVSLTDQTTPLAAHLNAVLARRWDAPLPPPQTIDVPQIEGDDAQLAQWLRQANPQLIALQQEVAQQRLAIQLARKDYYPNVTVF